MGLLVSESLRVYCIINTKMEYDFPSPSALKVAHLMITPDEALQVLEAKEREMAVGGEGMPCALQAYARQRAEPPQLDQACSTRARDRECEGKVASTLHNTCQGDTADEPGAPVDGVGAAGDDGAAARTATLSAVAGLRQPSPEAPAAALRNGAAGGARRDTLNASQVEYSHDDGVGSDVNADAHVDVLLPVPGRRDWGNRDSPLTLSDEILVERKLRRARQMPLAERRSRRYCKPQSSVTSSDDWPSEVP